MIYSVSELSGKLRNVWQHILHISIHFSISENRREIPTNFFNIEEKNSQKMATCVEK